MVNRWLFGRKFLVVGVQSAQTGTATIEGDIPSPLDSRNCVAGNNHYAQSQKHTGHRHFRSV